MIHVTKEHKEIISTLQVGRAKKIKGLTFYKQRYVNYARPRVTQDDFI